MNTDKARVLNWRLSGIGDQLREQRDAIRDAVDQNAFVRSVGAFADSANAIESRYAECRGEVAVRTAASGGFFQFYAEFERVAARGFE